MKKSCEMLQDSAVNAIGTYEFGWPHLAESTLARKSADTPLLETGKLRDSIGHVVESGDLGFVATNDPVAKWQEFGTSRIPPRPFLGGALAAKGDELGGIFGEIMEEGC